MAAALVARLGLRAPVFQAPMAGSQGSALAIAVAHAGGLGAIPAAAVRLDQLAAEIRAFRAATSAPLNVNFFCHAPPDPDADAEDRWRADLAPFYAEFGVDPSSIPNAPQRSPFSADALDAIAPFRPEVVSFHFGLPAPWLVDAVRRWGAIVISSATTVPEARWLESRGVDAVIAQGSEAGGHRGMFLDADLITQRPSQDLLPSVLAAVSVPVVAAGGFGDAAAVASGLRTGAQAVQVGTAFLLAEEAATTPVHRAALRAGGRTTALTNLFTGRPARGIVNRLMRERGPLRDDLPPFPLAAGALAPLRAAAEARGDGGFSPLWAGEGSTPLEGAAARVLESLLPG